MPTSSKLVIFLLLILNSYVGDAKVAFDPQDTIVKVNASDWRPYVYLENEKFKGYSYEILRAVFKRANMQFNLRIMSWARVYKFGLNKQSHMTLGVGRTAARESLFNWIGPVNKGEDIFFYQIKNKVIEIENLADVSKYFVGAQRGSYTHEFMTANALDKKLYLSVEQEQLVKMLLENRIDILLLSEKEMLEISKKLQLNPNIFSKAHFAFKVRSYMALNKTAPKVLIEKLTSAYQALSLEGKITLH